MKTFSLKNILVFFLVFRTFYSCCSKLPKRNKEARLLSHSSLTGRSGGEASVPSRVNSALNFSIIKGRENSAQNNEG
jgi:hypothetical protein